MGPTALLVNGLAVLAPIADNSFLIEEAYNQERGVVQHIAAFSRMPGTETWASTFTQEWPVDPAPRHQLSYTLSGASSTSEARGGFGDTLLSWRYQVVQGARLAVAPRASLLLPTGNWRQSRGSGGVGAELNLPVSLTTRHGLAAHWNAGITLVPRARNAAGDAAETVGVRVGQGLIWQARPRLNGMLELVLSRQEEIIGPDATAWQTSVVLSPGLRWAHDLPSGLQIVPGVAVPVELSGDPDRRWGVLLYVSFEHPFARERTR